MSQWGLKARCLTDKLSNLLNCFLARTLYVLKKDNFIPFLPSMEDFAIDTRDLLLFVSSTEETKRKDVTFLKHEMELLLILIQK